VSFTLDDDGQLSVRRGGGGMVSGLASVAGHADVLWVCAALSDADRAAARRAPGGRLGLDGAAGGAGVQMLDIPSGTFQRAYNAVANSTLWFVHHMLYDTPNQPHFGLAFRREWESFRAYNAAFAQALAANAGPRDAGSRDAGPRDAGPRDASLRDAGRRDNGLSGASPRGASPRGASPRGASPRDAGAAADRPLRAAVQDYHLTLVPRMLAELRPDIRIAHFTHTPWAPPEYYRMLPDAMGREVLAGILGADHAGFLCPRWADAFLDCCEVILGADVDRARQQVSYDGHVTGVGVHPLGVQADELIARAAEPDVQARVDTLAEAAGGRRLIVRIDRTELSKNIVRGLVAYRELLVTHPEWRGRVMHVAFAYPSRHDLPEYREYTASVQRVARQIEDEFGTDDWNPLILEVTDDYPRSLAAYRLADVLLVNPIRDGMNLVAKEGPILSDRGCALVLSTEAGAATELGPEALLVNPYDVTGTAEALHEALIMEDSERRRRAAALAQAASALPPGKWFADQLGALDQPG
jgi:trehalose 6-phosphate synthase